MVAANPLKSPDFRLLNRVCLVTTLLSILHIAVSAQKADPADPKNVERGIKLIEQAIEARGGVRYLNFKTLTATGQFTPFDKGISQLPLQFLDIIVYPDKERVEFGKGKKKNRKIQVYAGKTGWIYDGDNETLKDQTDKQIQAHLDELEYDLDRILRTGWKEPGVEVRFAGLEETRPGERAEAVAIQLKPERAAYLLLDRKSHLPLSLSYEKASDDGLIKYEIRFNQFVSYDGVAFPNIVDFYRNGIQESRVNYQSVKLDVQVEDELFVKPTNPKAIK